MSLQYCLFLAAAFKLVWPSTFQDNSVFLSIFLSYDGPCLDTLLMSVSRTSYWTMGQNIFWINNLTLLLFLYFMGQLEEILTIKNFGLSLYIQRTTLLRIGIDQRSACFWGLFQDRHIQIAGSKKTTIEAYTAQPHSDAHAFFTNFKRYSWKLHDMNSRRIEEISRGNAIEEKLEFSFITHITQLCTEMHSIH